MREIVRSGRKANFYITENSFIDNYAREVGTGGIAVYHVLERHMNCDTRATFVGTARMAALLDLSQRTVQRHLKTLEDLRLIRILRDETTTTYFVLPVPPRPKTATIPLFDGVPDLDSLQVGDSSVAEATSVSRAAAPASREAPSVSRGTTPASHPGDTSVVLYKEEQNSFNKTREQEGASPRQTAERVIAILALPATAGNLGMVEAALVAESDYTGQSLEEAANFLTNAAIEDRKNGIPINKFYFEDAKFRDRGANVRSRIGKAEQRKLHNLEINARVKQRFKDRFGNS